MRWKRRIEEYRIVWTSGRFGIVSDLRKTAFKVWYGMAFVGEFPKLKDAKLRIEQHLDEFR